MGQLISENEVNGEIQREILGLGCRIIPYEKTKEGNLKKERVKAEILFELKCGQFERATIGINSVGNILFGS